MCEGPADRAGNGAKSMHVSLANSLKMLQTDYVDIVRLLPDP